MRHLIGLPFLAVSLAASANAAPAPQESWGKSGVTLAQYRQDAIDCASLGYYLDIASTDDAKAFVTASRRLDSLPMGATAVSTTGSGSTGPSGDNSVQAMADFAGVSSTSSTASIRTRASAASRSFSCRRPSSALQSAAIRNFG